MDCPLCTSRRWPTHVEDIESIQCAICGKFDVTLELTLDVVNGRLTRQVFPFISAATRQASETDTRLTLTPQNVEAYIEAHRWTTFPEKARKLLTWIAKQSSFFSEGVYFSHKTDYPIIDAVSEQECWAILGHLQQRQLPRAGAERYSLGCQDGGLGAVAASARTRNTRALLCRDGIRSFSRRAV